MKLSDMTNQYRTEWGLKPLPFDAHTKPQPVRPTRNPHPTPPPDVEVAVTPLVRDWQHVMTMLLALEPVYTWAYLIQPGVVVDLATLEDACLVAAENAHAKEYHRLRDTYLSAVGELCERYWLATVADPWIDIVSLGLGCQPLRLYGQIPATFPPDSPPAFFAREIPTLLITPLSAFEAIYNTKAAIPGSRLVGST